MARPTRITINSGLQAWDADANDNLTNLFDRPLPIALHAGDETDLEATFAAALYDKCLIWVEHSVDGWKLYYSNGTAWAVLTTGGSGSSTLTIEAITGAATISAGTSLATCAGSPPYTVTLPTAASAGAGFQLYIKKTVAGVVTVDGDGSETINGQANYGIRNSQQGVQLVSDGSNWLVVAETQARPPIWGQESISGAATVGDFTDIVICSGTTYTVTLPAAATYGQGRFLTIKRNSSGTITIDGNAAETIDGAANFALDVALMSVTLYCTGAEWFIV